MLFVIPEAAKLLSGIHKHRPSKESKDLWLWIPALASLGRDDV
jgi:hypothetical protein